MSQYNELEQALKVADNPALGSTTERILAAEVRRLQAVNQTINAIWEEVDAYARNHSEIQLGGSVSQHALELMKDRDALKAELVRLREQKPVRWHVRGNYFHDGDAAILFASRNSMCGAKVEQLYAAPSPAVAAPAESNVYVAPIPAPESNPVQWLEDEGDNILVPRGLLGAACSAIDKQRQAPKVLEAMRHYTMNAPQAPAAPRKYHEFASVMLDAQPFITAETYGGRYIVAMRFERLGKMQDCHAALLALLQSAPTGEPK